MTEVKEKKPAQKKNQKYVSSPLAWSLIAIELALIAVVSVLVYINIH